MENVAKKDTTLMRSIEVFFSNGESLKTSINGTIASVFDYYLRRNFNLGNADKDVMAYGCMVEFDGIEYNPNTHHYISEEQHNRNIQLIATRRIARDNIQGPRIGDYLKVEGGFKRFTHDWDDAIQTSNYITNSERSGSFSIGKSGYASYSGGLDPAIKKTTFKDTGATKPGRFWMFNNDYAEAHNGIHFMLPCRVFEYVNQGA